jgi:hypothetical protein
MRHVGSLHSLPLVPALDVACLSDNIGDGLRLGSRPNCLPIRKDRSLTTRLVDGDIIFI